MTIASPLPGVDPEHQEILDVYHGSIEAMVAAQQAGDPDHPALNAYYIARTPALINVQNTIMRHDARDAYYTGHLVVLAAEVTEIALTDVPPTATIEACLDDSDYHLRFREDNSPVPGAQPGGRYSVTATALQGTDGSWYIVESTARWDEPC